MPSQPRSPIFPNSWFTSVPSTLVSNIDQIAAEEQVAARDMVVEIDVPGAGPIRMAGLPPKFTETPGRDTASAATAGRAHGFGVASPWLQRRDNSRFRGTRRGRPRRAGPSGRRRLRARAAKGGHSEIDRTTQPSQARGRGRVRSAPRHATVPSMPTAQASPTPRTRNPSAAWACDVMW